MASYREKGVMFSSGFFVGCEGMPGGAGFLLLQASGYVTALALIQQDPMLPSGGVEWELRSGSAAWGLGHRRTFTVLHEMMGATAGLP